MSEETAFLQAILDDPNDLQLRMVFADWLEERGDRRGKLLRLTHTLTQSVDVPGRAELEARLQHLVDEGVPAIGPFWTNSVGVRFAWIPPGTFLMGSPATETGRNNDETQHRVTLSKGFFLGVYQVTQKQWQTVMGDNPSHFKGKQRPVEQVLWQDCQGYCQKLSERDGKRYRLPTEAEWEYACRAGCTTAYNFGGDASKLGEHVWHEDNAAKRTHPVGQKKPNGWGLYDMHGNVWEWCNDRYGEYSSAEVIDPQGSNAGKYLVLRGGSWRSSPRYLRSAHRGCNVAAILDYGLGFRVVCCLD